MKKLAKLFCGIIAGTMMLGTASAFANTNQVVKVKIGNNVANVNGQNVTMDAMPYIQEFTNVTMIPLRFVSTAFGIPDSDITYDAGEKRIVIKVNKRFNEIDEITYFLNYNIGNYGYPELKNGRTYIPLRALCDALSLSVKWDSNTKTATMTSNVSLVNNSIDETNQNMNNDIAYNIQNNNSNNQNLTNTQDIRAMEEEVVRLVNEERAKYGLQPLQIDERLMQVAKLKSKDMFDNNYFSHTSQLYGSVTDMLKNIFNYKFDGYYLGAGENIHVGSITPIDAMESWLNSQGHKDNILNSNYKYIGVGLVGSTWTQVFIG